jgi:DNA-binding response OmpR family regulator
MPIIVLSPFGDEIKVEASAGADDYVTKPFGPRGFWPALRRCGAGPGADEPTIVADGSRSTSPPGRAPRRRAST